VGHQRNHAELIALDAAALTVESVAPHRFREGLGGAEVIEDDERVGISVLCRLRPVAGDEPRRRADAIRCVSTSRWTSSWPGSNFQRPTTANIAASCHLQRPHLLAWLLLPPRGESAAPAARRSPLADTIRPDR
jgi:hypothetical protein